MHLKNTSLKDAICISCKEALKCEPNRYEQPGGDDESRPRLFIDLSISFKDAPDIEKHESRLRL